MFNAFWNISVKIDEMCSFALQVEQMFRNINDIFIKSLQSVQKIMINDKHCFELYGYDILIDQDLKPWVINALIHCHILITILFMFDVQARSFKN